MNTQRTQVAIAALLAASIAGGAFGAPFIVNGSLTGPVGMEISPPGWFNANGTPDTCDENGPFNHTGHPWALSPDGGTFVRSGGPFTGPGEAFGQTISGFDIGVTYRIDFFQTNLAFVHPISGEYFGGQGQWEFFIDGALVAASNPMMPPPTIPDINVWEADSITFTATAMTHDLVIGARFIPGISIASYMGIDGLRIAEVPAPGAATLLATAMLASARRRRAVV